MNLVEEKEEIRKEILKRVRVGQAINYEDFKVLYKPYEKKITEVEFANTLEISYRNYMNMRNQGTRTKVFKSMLQTISEEEKEEIKREVLKQVKIGQSINYEEFQNLYNSYKKKLTEVDFAHILEINYLVV